MNWAMLNPATQEGIEARCVVQQSILIGYLLVHFQLPCSLGALADVLVKKSFVDKQNRNISSSAHKIVEKRSYLVSIIATPTAVHAKIALISITKTKSSIRPKQMEMNGFCTAQFARLPFHDIPRSNYMLIAGTGFMMIGTRPHFSGIQGSKRPDP